MKYITLIIMMLFVAFSALIITGIGDELHHNPKTDAFVNAQLDKGPIGFYKVKKSYRDYTSYVVTFEDMRVTIKVTPAREYESPKTVEIKACKKSGDVIWLESFAYLAEHKVSPGTMLRLEGLVQKYFNEN